MYNSRWVSSIFTYNLYPTSRARSYASTRAPNVRAPALSLVHLFPRISTVKITALVYGAADIWHRPERERERETKERFYTPSLPLSTCYTCASIGARLAHLVAHSRPDNQLCVKGTSSYAIQGVSPASRIDLKILTTILYALRGCTRTRARR